jgi:hypothetical protein
LIRTLLAGEGEGVCSEGGTGCSGEIEGEDSPGVGEEIGLGDSCAAEIATKRTQETQVKRSAIRDLSIVAPVHIQKNVVAPFAVAQKYFIGSVRNKLIVQTVEASKVIDRALSHVFPRSPGFHQKCPVT